MELNANNLRWLGVFCLFMIALGLSGAALGLLPFVPWTWKLGAALLGGPAAVVVLSERAQWPRWFAYLAMIAGLAGLSRVIHGLEENGAWGVQGYYGVLYGGYLAVAWWLVKVHESR